MSSSCRSPPRNPKASAFDPDDFVVVSLAEEIRAGRSKEMLPAIKLSSGWMSETFGGRNAKAREASLLRLVEGGGEVALAPGGRYLSAQQELDCWFMLQVSTGRTCVGVISMVTDDLCRSVARRKADEEDGPWLSCLFLHKSVRQGGLGRILVEHVAVAASRRGAGGVFLYTTEEKLAWYYGRLGFVLAPREHYAHTGVSVFRRELRHPFAATAGCENIEPWQRLVWGRPPVLPRVAPGPGATATQLRQG